MVFSVTGFSSWIRLITHLWPNGRRRHKPLSCVECIWPSEIGRFYRSSMRTLRIAMAQMNPTVGDLTGNIHRITTWLRDAKEAKVDLVVFPELAITGYPPEDLLLKSQFLADNLRALNEIAQACRGLV